MAATGTNDSTYLSSINYLKQREILNDLIDVYDEEVSIVQVLDELGLAKSTSVEEYHNFTEDYLYAIGTVAGTEAEPVAGAATDIVLTAGSVKPPVGDLAMTPGRKKMLVTAVSGNTVTVKPLNSANTAHEALSANDVITFYSNAYAEGTDVNLMRKSEVVKRSNIVQIFKTSTDITDLALGSKIEFVIDGKPYWMTKAQHDAYRKHEMDISFAFLLGEKSVGLTDADDNTVNTTMGLDEYINSYGIVQATAASGTFAREDLRLLSRKLDKVRAPKEYWWWTGGEIDTQIDDAFGDFTELKAGGISYNSFGKSNGKKKSIDLGFDALNVYHRTFHKKVQGAFDHERVTAAAGQTWPNRSMLLPTGQVKTSGKNGGMKPRLCTRYMEFPDGTNSRYIEMHDGALAPKPVGTKANWKIAYESIQGPEAVGVEHFAELNLS